MPTCHGRTGSVGDAGRRELVAASPRVYPLAVGVAVRVNGGLHVGWRALLSTPDSEGVPFQLVDVVEGVALVVIEA